ncbi:MAG TPA: hypothetical protein VFT61_06380 [Sphingomicrobium sp.]|nr:hypothetical protein [Sphingomicrobium sp.]
MPTIIEHLQELVIRHAEANNWAARTTPTLERVADLSSRLGLIMYKAAKAPPSPGYEPWLVKNGWSRIPARMMARLIVHHGERVANDLAWEPKARRALKALANPNIKSLAKRRRIKDLLSAWHKSHIVETIFDDAGLDVLQFIPLLEAEQGHAVPSDPRIAQLAALAISYPAKRGPKVSVASAAHGFVLENVLPGVGGAAYSWSSVSRGCTDHASEATLREFGLPRFDARAAVRRRSRTR